MTPEQRLAALVERVSGVVVGDQNLPRLRALARERAAVNGFPDLPTYVDALRRVPEGAEWREILGRITIKESSLFRGPNQFAALVNTVVPSQIAAGRRTIRVWSAGCARGEETATLAVTLAACTALGGSGWSILGTDVDEDALNLARRAVFPRRSVRRVPPQMLERFFERQGDCFRLAASLRRRIQFRYLNLVQLPQAVPEGPFDAIFLRNVLIYFREDSQAQVVSSIASYLSPGGFLFVGPSESLRQAAPQFEARDLGGCFGYQVSDLVEEADGGRGAVFQRKETDRIIRDRVWSREVAVETAIAAYEKGNIKQAQSVLYSFSGVPEDPLLYAFAGFLAERSGRLADAVRAYRAASYLDQSLYQVRFMMAQCLDRSGWAGRAKGEYRSVASLLARGEGTSLPWAARLGLPDQTEVEKRCGKKLEGLVGHHQSTLT